MRHTAAGLEVRQKNTSHGSTAVHDTTNRVYSELFRMSFVNIKSGAELLRLLLLSPTNHFGVSTEAELEMAPHNLYQSTSTFTGELFPLVVCTYLQYVVLTILHTVEVSYDTCMISSCVGGEVKLRKPACLPASVDNYLLHFAVCLYHLV